MSGGDLKKQLDEVEFFSEKKAKFYTAEITLAIQFLHQHEILQQECRALILNMYLFPPSVN